MSGIPDSSPVLASADVAVGAVAGAAPAFEPEFEPEPEAAPALSEPAAGRATLAGAEVTGSVKTPGRTFEVGKLAVREVWLPA